MLNHIGRRSFLCLTVSSLLTRSVTAQTPDAPSVILAATRLQAASNELMAMSSDKSQYVWGPDAVGNVNLLVEHLPKYNISDSYAKALNLNAGLLETAAAADNVEAIVWVQEDVALKLGVFKNPTLVTRSDFDGTIPTEVSTLHKNEPVHGLLIRFYMQGQPDDDDPFYSFNTPTSPTEGKVAPGKYIAHVLDREDRPPRLKQRVTVDGMGGEVERIVINIP